MESFFTVCLYANRQNGLEVSYVGGHAANEWHDGKYAQDAQQ
jgi:hypothetical protein